MSDVEAMVEKWRTLKIVRIGLWWGFVGWICLAAFLPGADILSDRPLVIKFLITITFLAVNIGFGIRERFARKAAERAISTQPS